jgi:predicted TIM-barrel fold metal-dependent hydrolase
MFIDIHVHTVARPAPLRRGAATYASPEYLLRRYDLLGIERAVILPTSNPECAHHIQSSEEALDIAARHPGRFIPFCNIDPRMDTNDEKANLRLIAEYYKSQGCKGCGEVCANMPFDEPRMQNLFAACEATGLPLTFHIADRIGGYYGIHDEAGLPGLERALRRFPKLTFLGHSQAFWAEIGPMDGVTNRQSYPKGPVARPGRVIELMRRYPGLCGDLSAGSGCNAVRRDEEFGLSFMEEFQDRLYFGTDICEPDTETPLVDYLLRLRAEGKLPESVFRKISRENALRLLS